MEDFVGMKRVKKSELLGGTIAKSLDIYAEILHTHYSALKDTLRSTLIAVIENAGSSTHFLIKSKVA